MSKRAEEAALQRYAMREITHENVRLYDEFEAGYEQAEKDIWNKIEKYLSEQDPRNYATAGFILKNFEYFKQQIMEEEYL